MVRSENSATQCEDGRVSAHEASPAGSWDNVRLTSSREISIAPPYPARPLRPCPRPRRRCPWTRAWAMASRPSTRGGRRELSHDSVTMALQCSKIVPWRSRFLRYKRPLVTRKMRPSWDNFWNLHAQPEYKYLVTLQPTALMWACGSLTSSLLCFMTMSHISWHFHFHYLPWAFFTLHANWK